MKYIKLFEDELEDFLGSSYSLEEIIEPKEHYTAFGKVGENEYDKITSGSLEQCISYYKLNKKNSSEFAYDKIIIVKTNTTKELFKEDDIEAIIDAKKYNL